MEESLIRRTAMQIKRVQLLKSAAADRALASVGLSMSLWAVLDSIRREPDRSSHALAEACFMTDQSFGELAKKLQQRGLVERTPGPGRIVRHRMTQAGDRLYDEATPLIAQAFAKAFSALTEIEIEALAVMLERIGSDREDHDG